MTVGENLARLKAAFPRQDMTLATFEQYALFLRDIPDLLLDSVVDSLIATEKWLPSIAQIREAAADTALQLPTESAALTQIYARIAWTREGDDTRPDVHPLVKKALDLVGGYPAFRTSEDPAVVRGQFGRIYRDLRAAEIRHVQTSPTEMLAAGSRPREISA